MKVSLGGRKMHSVTDSRDTDLANAAEDLVTMTAERDAALALLAVRSDALGAATDDLEAAHYALARRTAELELARAFALPSLGYSIPDPATLPVAPLVHDGLVAEMVRPAAIGVAA